MTAPNYDPPRQILQPADSLANSGDPSAWGAHLPIFVLALAFAVFLGGQIMLSMQGARAEDWQIKNLDKRIEATKAAQKQAEERAQQFTAALKQAEQLQNQDKAFFADAFDLAKEDEDTRKVLQKLRININQGSDAAPEKKQ